MLNNHLRSVFFVRAIWREYLVALRSYSSGDQAIMIEAVSIILRESLQAESTEPEISRTLVPSVAGRENTIVISPVFFYSLHLHEFLVLNGVEREVIPRWRTDARHKIATLIAR
jgi:hypothetical protein